MIRYCALKKKKEREKERKKEKEGKRDRDKGTATVLERIIHFFLFSFVNFIRVNYVLTLVLG